MRVSQQINRVKFFRKASFRQRLAGGGIFIAVSGLFVFLWLADKGKIDISRLVNPCGLKQRYDLPCPTCGVTTSAIAFAGGRIFKAFYIQPAGALLCAVMAVAEILAFLTAVFGVYLVFLDRFFAEVKIGYIILALLAVIICGWAVTLARAVVNR